MARSKVFDEIEVLDKAMHLFWKKGYNATSAQDLVDTLGISRSSLYDTYGDKHKLYIEALKQYKKLRIDPVISTLEKTEDMESYIKALFEFMKTEAQSEGHLHGCFMINATVEMAACDPEVMKIATEIMHATEEALYKAIKKGQEKRVFSKNHSARALARFMINNWNGFRVTMKYENSKRAYDDIVQLSLATLKGK
jgi:TetR/AcrR family transcriptional repressor of nem operon